jgi:hypothetical protein
MSAASKHDYPALFQEYDQRLAGGESPKEIRATFESRGIVWGTFQNRRSQAKRDTIVHQRNARIHQRHTKVHPKGTRRSWRIYNKVSPRRLMSSPKRYPSAHRNTQAHQKYTRI